jgi:methionyl aminopeptidase
MNTTPSVLPGRNDPCWCGSGSKYKKCHAAEDAVGARAQTRVAPRAVSVPLAHRQRPGAASRALAAGQEPPRREVPASIPRPHYAQDPPQPYPGRIPARPLPDDVIARMRRAGAAARTVLEETGKHVRAGITTDELDRIAHELTIELGAYPSPLGYAGGPGAFPKSICTSVNEVICHGIPDDRELQDGDIVNIDVTCYLDGVHGDNSLMFLVGDVDPERRRLVEVTERAMHAGIATVRHGSEVRDIGRAIEAVAKAEGLGVVQAFVGHGVGEWFHTEPTVYHYFEPKARMTLEAGMTLTVEPMLNLGSWRHAMWDDGWTAVTADLSPSAQFEHTILVTETGAELLTVREGAEQPHR